MQVKTSLKLSLSPHCLAFPLSVMPINKITPTISPCCTPMICTGIIGQIKTVNMVCRTKTLIDRIRHDVEQKGGSVILLNAGDFNTGVPESDLQNAKPDIEALNMMGYEALTLGNHEFDNPLQLLEMQEKWAKFPFLAANVINQKTGKLLVQPYTILKKQDLNIAVVGLTTEDTAKLGNPEFISAVKFERPTDAAKTFA